MYLQIRLIKTLGAFTVDAKRKINSGKKSTIKLKPTYKIQNIVASADLKTDIDLYILGKLSFDIDYEPEQFPGAIFKVHNPESALLLFKNGKIICTGAKTRVDVRRAVQHAVDLVNRYKKQLKHKTKSIKSPNPVSAKSNKSTSRTNKSTKSLKPKKKRP